MSAQEGSNTWIVYANDTSNNVNSSSVTFFVDSIAPTINFTGATSSGTVNGNTISVNLTTSDTSNHYSFVDFDRSLSLWYRMDDVNSSGDPVGSSSYGLNGSRKGAAVQTNLGNFGKGFDFSGSNISYVSASVAGFSNPTNQITISVWVLNNNLSNWNRLVSRDSWSTAGKYSWQLYESSNRKVTFGISNGTAQEGPSSATNSLSNGVWHHVVATYNGTIASIYLDGSLASSQTQNSNFTGLTFSSISYLYLGSSNSVNSNSYFNGTLDEVLIFNRSLNAAEIASLYSASASQYSNNFTGLSRGTYTFTGYAVDSFGNKNQTETRTVTLADTTAPSVSITYPVNASYSSSTFGLNYTASDETALDSCWYSLNGGANSTTQTCNTNWAGLTGVEGSNNVFVYANDSSSNVGSSSLTFVVDTVNPGINFTGATSSGTITGNSIFVNLTTSDTSNHYSFVDFDNSLIGWWRGESNANDDIGLHNASWVGTAIYGAGKFGS